MIITIDGPAGSGKSTVARKLAMRLGFLHLNSGALFRAAALRARERHLPLDDDAAIAQVAKELNFQFLLGEKSETIFLVDGADISNVLAQEDVGKIASAVALLPSVRAHLLEVQRRTGAAHSLVVEGRDSGTVVFPDADKKFYLDADLDVRAERRLREHMSGQAAPEVMIKARDAVRKQLTERDRQDANRKFAPHRKADDAIVIDTSRLAPDEVIDRIVEQLGKTGKMK